MCLNLVAALNENAENACELYPQLSSPPPILAEVLLSPARAGLQENLHSAIKEIESQKTQ